MTTQQTTLYRDKQNAKLMGVCSGIADYTGVNVLWVRLGALILAFSTGFAIPIYFVAGLLLNKKPPHLYLEKEEQKYWQGVRQSPQRTAREIRSQMRDIDRRLADVETYSLTSNPRLTAEIERLR
jgi:phage shock protein C